MTTPTPATPGWPLAAQPAETVSAAPPEIEMGARDPADRPTSPASTITLASVRNALSLPKGHNTDKTKGLELPAGTDGAAHSSDSHAVQTPPPRRRHMSLSCFHIRDRISEAIRRRHSPAPSAWAPVPAPAKATFAQTAEMRRLKADINGILDNTKPNTGADVRVLQLQYDAIVANATTKPRSTATLFRDACSTDLLFLIDTTGSMAPYLNAATAQVRTLVDEIKASFFNDADVRIAVVGYKDHSDGVSSIQSLDFTASVDRVHSFLGELSAFGGGDAPEDVLGGIREALNKSWRQRTRCLIHICDSPAHGRDLHDLDEASDRYPVPGSEPHRLTHGRLLAQMIGLGINYAMLRINHTTDRMALNFLQAYLDAAPDCKLHTENKYYQKARDAAEEARKKPHARRRRGHALQFEEHQLGTSYSTLQHLVVQSVTSSASRTASRLSGSTARDSLDSDDRPGKFKRLGFGLKAIKEDDANIIGEEEDEFIDADLEDILPKWGSPSFLDKRLVAEAFSTDVAPDASLDDMLASDAAIPITATELTILKRKRPFAQGAMRVAAYALALDSSSPLVVKSFKRSGKQLAHLADDMRIQVLCKAFALEFNALLPAQPEFLDFVVATCLKPKAGGGEGNQCMSLEPFMSGAYVKYNSNSGYVNDENANCPINMAAQAFSHFTFERSQGKFLVCDVQGVGYTMTDPAIHTADPERFKLVDTNLGEAGFKFFFATHRCNDLCKQLGLASSTNAMSLTAQNMHKKDWAPKGKTKVEDAMVCCANKMCRRILRAAEAHSMKEGDWEGLQWCEPCWKQLEGGMRRETCREGGGEHLFEVSSFFDVARGEHLSGVCRAHR
jgi:hypothetical protein